MKKSIILGLLMIIIISCTKSVSKNDALDIFVSVLPQKYFVERIAGDKADVHVMVLPGHSPATYEPTPSQMKEISDADLYFRIGVPFEETWMNKLEHLNPDMTIIDTRKGISLRPMDSFATLQDKMSHEYHAEKHTPHDHSHQLDPHIWLSPELVKRQAMTICETLQEYDADNTTYYQANLQSFLDDLAALQQYFRDRLSNLTHRAFLVFHPSWGYLADEFRLMQIPIQIEGKSPAPKELAEIISYALKKNIRIVFVQKQFSTTAAETVAQAIDGKVVSIDPLAENYLENMKTIADTFQEALDED
ncbi:MAG: zinc ABC transporter substrate-binding protein [Candidatus Cloacimonetes bacterium]|nr:zinc ABC transporter substrate-binding protein [Candidatus Cloacimonadota bacterium]